MIFFIYFWTTSHYYTFSNKSFQIVRVLMHIFCARQVCWISPQWGYHQILCKKKSCTHCPFHKQAFDKSQHCSYSFRMGGQVYSDKSRLDVGYRGWKNIRSDVATATLVSSISGTEGPPNACVMCVWARGHVLWWETVMTVQCGGCLVQVRESLSERENDNRERGR